MINEKWIGLTYTDTGLIRSQNEDSVLEKNSEQLWAVADGMGGHMAGDYASQHVLENLSGYENAAQTGTSLARHDNAVRISNAHLVEKALSEQVDIIGCTLATLIIDKQWAVCSWSGDSRIYRLRHGELKLLTHDHSQQSDYDDRNLLLYSDVAKTDSQVLTAAIGGEDAAYLERAWYGTDDDDSYLLCTDGLYKEASDIEIEHLMKTTTTASDALHKLVAVYRERGARDNVGLVYVSQHC